MTPNYEKAAIMATETLIKYGINSAPILPLPIFFCFGGNIKRKAEEDSQAVKFNVQVNSLTEGCVASWQHRRGWSKHGDSGTFSWRWSAVVKKKKKAFVCIWNAFLGCRESLFPSPPF